MTSGLVIFKIEPPLSAGQFSVASALAYLLGLPQCTLPYTRPTPLPSRTPSSGFEANKASTSSKII
jgi:hypothetical protein